jgi:hypothetical protein
MRRDPGGTSAASGWPWASPRDGSSGMGAAIADLRMAGAVLPMAM